MALIIHVSTHFKIFFGEDVPEHPMYNMYHDRLLFLPFPFTNNIDRPHRWTLAKLLPDCIVYILIIWNWRL